MTGSLDLPAYLARTGASAPFRPTLAALEELSLRHVGAIPFENLGPFLGEPVRLDLASLQAKLVGGGRGGYCFEHNLLFAAVLEEAGFAPALRDARVRFEVPAGVVLPRTHAVLEVEAEGRRWLADVGFGASGLLGPVPLDGAEIERFGERWRLLPGGLLQAELGQGWKDLYEVQAGAAYPVDWAVASHYCSTHPDSRFVRTFTAQLTAPGNRRVLRGRTLTDRRGIRELTPREAVAEVKEGFGLRLERAAEERLLEALSRPG
jgi:N-hydroxyarylamine O-acetyltransferase